MIRTLIPLVLAAAAIAPFLAACSNADVRYAEDQRYYDNHYDTRTQDAWHYTNDKGLYQSDWADRGHYVR